MRGYRYWFVRYLQLKVVDAGGACGFIGGLLDPSSGLPQITFATTWTTKPPHCVNLAVTYRGLVALGIGADTKKSLTLSDFATFVTGASAPKTAARMGDLGQNDPKNWIYSDKTFDVVIAIWADTPGELDDVCAALKNKYEPSYTLVATVESQDLPDNLIYFGYRDGIAQPTITYNPTQQAPDEQDKVDPASFALGQSDTWPDGYYRDMPIPRPNADFAYGCFGSLRMLKQDVEAFEAFVEASYQQIQTDYGLPNADVARKAVMALVIGRWPNGAALMDHPITSDLTDQPVPPGDYELNDFQYHGDPGANCPYTAHIRRSNPRDDLVAGGLSIKESRIMRRAMPYQVPFEENNRHDPTTERGLLGFFLSASLQKGFELVLGDWVDGNGALATDPADPAIGYNIFEDQQGSPDAGYTLTYQGTVSTTGPLQIPRPFLTTRGSAYVFLPGRPGLQWLANLTPTG